jgi:hypothetical protein
LQAVINDTTTMYVQDNTPASEAHYRARFYFDPNSLTMAANDTHIIFQTLNISSTSVFQVLLWFESGTYKLIAQSRKDDSTWDNTARYAISDTVHYVEVDWQAASAPGANTIVLPVRDIHAHAQRRG